MRQTLTKITLRASHWLAGSTAHRWVKREDGAAAVEFAMVLAPFLALVFAIMETALVFFAGQALETAVADSARLILTGQAQTQGMSQDQFKQAVCAKITGMFDCVNGITINVQTFSSFSQVTMLNPVDPTGKFNPQSLQFQLCSAGQICVVQLFYQWPVFVSLLGFNLTDMAGGKRLLAGTAAFKVEPYN
jgi:Flp pilus assembly protein TadG